MYIGQSRITAALFKLERPSLSKLSFRRGGGKSKLKELLLNRT